MQSSVLLLCLALIACVLAQTPPTMAPQFQAVTNTTIETEGRTNVYPGAWWYDLTNNRDKTQLQLPSISQVELQIFNNTGGVVYAIQTAGTHTVCEAHVVTGSNNTVNAFGWLASAKYLGATTINGKAVQEFYGEVSQTKFTLYVETGTNTPVRFIVDKGAIAVQADFLSYVAEAPPASVFTPPTHCV